MAWDIEYYFLNTNCFFHYVTFIFFSVANHIFSMLPREGRVNNLRETRGCQLSWLNWIMLFFSFLFNDWFQWRLLFLTIYHMLIFKALCALAMSGSRKCLSFEEKVEIIKCIIMNNVKKSNLYFRVFQSFTLLYKLLVEKTASIFFIISFLLLLLLLLHFKLLPLFIDCTFLLW